MKTMELRDRLEALEIEMKGLADIADSMAQSRSVYNDGLTVLSTLLYQSGDKLKELSGKVGEDLKYLYSIGCTEKKQ